jgi:hypothetical protein
MKNGETVAHTRKSRPMLPRGGLNTDAGDQFRRPTHLSAGLHKTLVEGDGLEPSTNKL